MTLSWRFCSCRNSGPTSTRRRCPRFLAQPYAAPGATLKVREPPAQLGPAYQVLLGKGPVLSARREKLLLRLLGRIDIDDLHKVCIRPGRNVWSFFVLYLALGIVHTFASAISDQTAVVVSFLRVAVCRQSRPAAPATPALRQARQNCRSSSSVIGRAPPPARWRFIARTRGEVNSSSRPAYNRRTSGQFDAVHYFGNVAPPECSNSRGPDFRQNQTMPDRFILIGRSVLQMTATRHEEWLCKDSEGVPLARRRGLFCSSICDRISSTPAGTNMLCGLFPGLLRCDGRILAQDHAATLGEAAPPNSELDHEGSPPCVAPMGAKSP